MTIFVLKVLSIFLLYGCANPAFNGGKDAVHEATKIRATSGASPLRVNALNPRYFTDGSGRAIYLTGSHTWDNLVDSTGKPVFDYSAYLDFIQSYNHNFIRLWTRENASVAMPNGVWLENHPVRYLRTGPGSALDGKPKFDLTKFDPRYFDRLRSRVLAASNRGFYVMVMLFNGFSVHDKGGGRVNPWPGHPFHAQNNVNGISGDANGNGEGEEVHTLKVHAVTRIQEVYVRRVVDTLNDLDNVLYEISNESHRESVEWQYHIIRFIHRYQKNQPKQHPVAMTFLWNGHGDNGDRHDPELFASPADAISPGRGPKEEYISDSPHADGSKVIISDTDHLWGIGGDSDWVWKSFQRGLNPIFMDPIGDPNWNSIRRSMGQTLAVSKRINLAKMLPRKDLASSGYCLANPGVEYLVYLPLVQRDESQVAENLGTLLPHSVELDLTQASGTFNVEWFNPTTSEFTRAGRVDGGARRSLTAPFGSPAILHLTVTQANS
jgi:hypothetical protein